MYYLKDGETAVLTGDFNNLLLWGGIGIVAILIVVINFLLKSRKKKNYKIMIIKYVHFTEVIS